jgi:hypothetical protein
MNPAALKVNLADFEAGGLLIINKDEFTKLEPRARRLRLPTRWNGALSGYRTW